MARIKRFAFPNGNVSNKTSDIAGSVDQTRPAFLTQSRYPRHCNPPWDANYPLLFATPHHHRDVARFRLKYDPTPEWLPLVGHYLAEDASAVILTYPSDVAAVKTLLAALGFPEPYHVVPVYQSFGTETPHAEVMVIAQRPTPPDADQFRMSVKGEMQYPAHVGKRLQPRATKALLLFAQDNSLLFDSPPNATNIFGSPWRHPQWPASISPSCWSTSDEESAITQL